MINCFFLIFTHSRNNTGFIWRVTGSVKSENSFSEILPVFSGIQNIEFVRKCKYKYKCDLMGIIKVGKEELIDEEE